MIVDGILSVLAVVLNLLLSPLEIINISVDFVSGIGFVADFFAVIAYIIPWASLLPLFAIIASVISFKIIVSFLKTLWDILPLV